jgi:hypothetical protein
VLHYGDDKKRRMAFEVDLFDRIRIPVVLEKGKDKDPKKGLFKK